MFSQVSKMMGQKAKLRMRTKYYPTMIQLYQLPATQKRKMDARRKYPKSRSRETHDSKSYEHSKPRQWNCIFNQRNQSKGMRRICKLLQASSRATTKQTPAVHHDVSFLVILSHQEEDCWRKYQNRARRRMIQKAGRGPSSQMLRRLSKN